MADSSIQSLQVVSSAGLGEPLCQSDIQNSLQMVSSACPGEPSRQEDKVLGWKTVVVHDGKFHAAVIGKVSQGNVCEISPVSFHKYVRKEPFPRWLDHTGARRCRGDMKMRKLAKLLGLQQFCTWRPSERMQTSSSQGCKRKDLHGVGKQDDSSSGFEALVSPVWLILYTLLVNCCNLRKATIAAKGLRKRAFEILDLLVRLSSEASGAATLRTHDVTFSVTEDGHLRGIDATGLGDTKELAQVHAAIQEGQARDHARVGEGVVVASKLSGMLWLLTRLLFTRLKGKAFQVARGLACDLVMFTADAVSHWFVSLPASGVRSVELIAAQPSGSRTMPELVARLLQKARPRTTAQQWRADGIHTVPNASYLERRASTAYLCNVHAKMGAVSTIGLSLDSTTFATKEMNVTMAYAPAIDLGAYLPPIRCRRLRWRSSAAGSDVSATEKAQFLKTGLRTTPRMEIWDFVSELEHILKSGLGKSLKDFRFVEDFPVMVPGEVRYYHPLKKQWYRVPASGPAGEGTPELSQKALSMSPNDIGVLLLDEDQKQSQWSASHFLVDPEDGLSLMVWFRGDKYHRTWRDWQWAANKADGHFNWTAVQLNYAFNVNYQPFGAGGHFSKRQEIKLDWERLFPTAGPKFEAFAGNIGLDSRRPPPTGLGGIQSLYKKFVLDDDLCTVKGQFMKQSAWYDIIKRLDKWDPLWHARRFETEEVAQYLRGEGVESKAFVAKVARDILSQEKGMEEHTMESQKESYQARMKHLRKAAGNCLLLAPRMMHNINLVNARVMLLVSRVMWTEQTFWGMLKVTPEQDFQISVRLASGAGQDTVKQMWKKSVTDARELHRLGMRVVEGEPFIDVSQPTGLGGKDMEPGMPLEEVPSRLMGFLLHFMEARLWSYAWFQFSFPEAFAGLFSDEYADQAWTWAQQLWEASTDAEANAHMFPAAWSLRQEVYWLSWALVQFVLRWMAHMNFKPAFGFLCQFLLLCLKRLGDTKGVEETHRMGRGLENEGQSRHVLEADVFFARMQRDDTPFDHRGVPHLRSDQQAHYCPIANSKLPASGLDHWNQIFAKQGLMRMPSFLNQKKRDILAGKYLTKTPASGRTSITAAQALVMIHGLKDLSLATHVWQGVCFVPHTLVRLHSTVFLVLLADTYAGFLWAAHPCPEESELKTKRWVFDVVDHWHWKVITDAKEWRFIPARWVANTHDVARFGYLAAEQTSDDVPIVAEVLVQTNHRQLKIFRKELCNLYVDSTAAGLPASGSMQLLEQQQLEEKAMITLLDGYPVLQQYLDRLKCLHKKKKKKSKKQIGKPPQDNDDKVESASSSSNESDIADQKGCALTFACLDNLDEKNREELKKDTKTRGLFGFKAVKRVARAMVREDREVYRQSKTSCTGLGQGGVKIKCNFAWARAYVPGSEESGVTLPANTEQSCLNNPPGRNVWVARFRHPMLTDQKKRPTHSRSYLEAEGKRTEHVAFQKVVTWLWERYEMACRLSSPPEPASGRPDFVQSVLTTCPACEAGEVCTFMSELRSVSKEQEHAESDQGSVWSGAGTSASESSEDEGGSVVDSKPKHGVSRGGKSKLGTGLGPSKAEGSQDTLLLLGDSNAAGYCETHPLPKSLRFQLASKFAVCSAAKSGTSWKSIAKDIHNHIKTYTKEGTARHHFKYVLVVLGTNDIPMEKQWEKQKDTLKEAMETVLDALKDYVWLGDPKGRPDLKRILVTQAFSFEERACDRFAKLTEEVADRFGAQFVAVPWDKERHMQTKTKTPLKHFNFAGVELLFQRVCSAVDRLQTCGKVEPSLPASGAIEISVPASAPASGARDISVPASGAREISESMRVPSGRVPTRRGAPSSSSNSPSNRSSSSSSSSSSSGVKPGDSHRSGLKTTHLDKKKMKCEACGTFGDHVIQDCPLVLAAMFDGDVAAAMKAVHLLDCRYRPQGRLAKQIPPSEFQIIRVPPDGNCLFASLMVNHRLSNNEPIPAYDARGQLGANCRQAYLRWIAPILKRNSILPGSDLQARALLVDASRWGGHEQYLERMQEPVRDRRQWGSWPEALCIALKWKMKVCVFRQDVGGSLVLLQAPCGAETAEHTMSLLWNGSHYDALKLGVAIEVTDCAIWT